MRIISDREHVKKEVEFSLLLCCLINFPKTVTITNVSFQFVHQKKIAVIHHPERGRDRRVVVSLTPNDAYSCHLKWQMIMFALFRTLNFFHSAAF